MSIKPKNLKPGTSEQIQAKTAKNDVQHVNLKSKYLAEKPQSPTAFSDKTTAAMTFHRQNSGDRFVT